MKKYISSFLKTFIIIVLQAMTVSFIIYMFLFISPTFKSFVHAENTIQVITWYFTWMYDFLAGSLKDMQGNDVIVSLKEASKITFPLVIFSLFSSYIAAVIIYYLSRIRRSLFVNNYLLKFIKVLSAFHYIIFAYFLRSFFFKLDYSESLLPYFILAVGNLTLYELILFTDDELGRIFTSDFIKATKVRGGKILKNVIKPFIIFSIKTNQPPAPVNPLIICWKTP